MSNDDKVNQYGVAPEQPVLDAEDAKLVTLARGARGRVGASAGAAVRDETGRTYSGATVNLPHLTLSALALAVAQAVASGAQGLECAVVVSGDGGVFDDDLVIVRDLGGDAVRVIGARPTGEIVVDMPGVSQ